MIKNEKGYLFVKETFYQGAYTWKYWALNKLAGCNYVYAKEVIQITH